MMTKELVKRNRHSICDKTAAATTRGKAFNFERQSRLKGMAWYGNISVMELRTCKRKASCTKASLSIQTIARTKETTHVYRMAMGGRSWSCIRFGIFWAHELLTWSNLWCSVTPRPGHLHPTLILHHPLEMRQHLTTVTRTEGKTNGTTAERHCSGQLREKGVVKWLTCLNTFFEICFNDNFKTGHVRNVESCGMHCWGSFSHWLSTGNWVPFQVAIIACYPLWITLGSMCDRSNSDFVSLWNLNSGHLNATNKSIIITSRTNHSPLLTNH